MGPGLAGSGISISVRQGQPPVMGQSFVPESAIWPPIATPASSPDRLTWNTLDRWPIAIVPPGQAVDRTIALDTAFPFRKNTEYDVSLGVTLTLFIGEAGDPDARLFPERRIVSGQSRFRW